MSQIRYASVCSGVEAASLAWEPLGWKPVFFSEIEPFPCEVLRQRFPDVQNVGDMTKIDGEKYAGAVDLLVGGTPCQGFSVAGKQRGLDDERSCLAMDYVRLLETMRPRWFVWENVPGALSTNGGMDFKRFIEAIDAVGYHVAWRVLDAQYVRVDGFPGAVPQRRRRLFADILETGDIPPRYYLSRQMCLGIIRRSDARGVELPLVLRQTLEWQAEHHPSVTEVRSAER